MSKYRMPKKEISDHDISKVDGNDAFGQACMAAVCVGGMLAGSLFACILVTAKTRVQSLRTGADYLTERRNVLRVGGQFPKCIVKDRNAYLS